MPWKTLGPCQSHQGKVRDHYFSQWKQHVKLWKGHNFLVTIETTVNHIFKCVASLRLRGSCAVNLIDSSWSLVVFFCEMFCIPSEWQTGKQAGRQTGRQTDRQIMSSGLRPETVVWFQSIVSPSWNQSYFVVLTTSFHVWWSLMKTAEDVRGAIFLKMYPCWLKELSHHFNCTYP